MNLDEHTSSYGEDLNHSIMFSTESSNEINESHDKSSGDLKEEEDDHEDFEIDFDDI